MSTRAGEAAANLAFYGHWICPFATRVEFALHQRGIAHDVVDVPPSAVRGPDFVLPDEFVEHSPRLEIPMVRVGNDYLADSLPILEWLEHRVDAPALLPADDVRRAQVQERMEWIDKHAFRPMIGVYYGVDPDAIAQASDPSPRVRRSARRSPASLAEAVAMPIHVRMAGLRRLGFTGTLTAEWLAHGERCRALDGWPSVEWSPEQTDEFVGRFEALRRKRRSREASDS